MGPIRGSLRPKPKRSGARPGSPALGFRVLDAPQEDPEVAALTQQVEGLQSQLRAAGGGGGEAWRRWRSVEDFPRDRPLFVSFSNAHYADLMLNWVMALRVLDVRC